MRKNECNERKIDCAIEKSSGMHIGSERVLNRFLHGPFLSNEAVPHLLLFLTPISPYVQSLISAGP